MQHTLEIIAAVVLLIFVELAMRAVIRRIGKGIGNKLGKLVRPGARKLLTPYDRRKVIQQRQDQRVKDGVPPLENLHLE
jgi:hypothetical protein